MRGLEKGRITRITLKGSTRAKSDQRWRELEGDLEYVNSTAMLVW